MKIIRSSPQDQADSKLTGKHLDHLERQLVPIYDEKLYLVMGRTGVYSNNTYRKWTVRAFRSQKAAEIFSKACSEHAFEWDNLRKHSDESPPYGWSLLDPNMICEYNGTRYKVYTIPLALSEAAILELTDTCPICNTQVNITPEGRICENGHDL